MSGAEWARLADAVAAGGPGATPPVADLGFAAVDLARAARTGDPEVVFGEGKSPAQIEGVLRALAAAGQPGLVTRVDVEKAAVLCAALPGLVHHAVPRLLHLPAGPAPAPQGLVAVVAAGTSDLPVAEEAAVTAELLGCAVLRVVDVGVAGLHRLLRRVDELRQARVIIVVAGMEGALPSVVTGLVTCPVIGVPTSVGYGANLGGITALLGMVNSCAAGLAVVNVDNGFGAGLMAARINRRGGA
ncbi:MAG: nickel pincer cofactor biosynthesis protein LarB [Deltaproteobacteria bacterium]|nr:nickel pincer cofactor biosynthesis protein LarB [Deltaproteobacteria bacterium]